jgi:LacI family transcriptional regulator
MRKKNKVTMKEIASHVGVSINTVSRALTDKSDINIKTKDLIRNTAIELGYHYKARESEKYKTTNKIIGLVVADNANPFFAQVAKAIQETLWRNKYTLILCNTNEEYIREQEAIELLIDRKVDGIIITPTQSQDKDIPLLQSSGIPFVLLGRHFSSPTVPNVISDDATGAYDAINHLIRLGHSKILFINAPEYNSSARERLEGMLRAFRDNGIEHNKSLIRICFPKMELAYNEMKSILLEKLEFTAVFTYNDLMMLGVVKMFQETGISVPEDISLMGFDDIDFVSLLTPALTTVSIDKYNIGVESANMLLRIIHGEKVIDNTKLVPSTLIVRNSTRKI